MSGGGNTGSAVPAHEGRLPWRDRLLMGTSNAAALARWAEREVARTTPTITHCAARYVAEYNEARSFFALALWIWHSMGADDPRARSAVRGGSMGACLARISTVCVESADPSPAVPDSKETSQ